jgi:hypothetical protein
VLLINKIQNGFILGGGITDSISANAMLYKYDDNGKLLWSVQYGDTGFQSGYMSKETPDGNYILCGQDATDGTFGGNDFLFIKTDTSGNLIWHKTYGDSTTADLAYAITCTTDEGYVLAGEKMYSMFDYDMFLVKTDNIGNVQWERHIGGN